MAIVCPSITADSEDEYRQQMEKIVHLAKRIHIDLTDGQLAENKLIEPKDAWWPVGFTADFHLMYQHPHDAVEVILQHKPNLIIVHAESDAHLKTLANYCHSHEVKIGVALLQQTAVDAILPALDQLDHVLIFSGDLGHYGGSADLGLLDKVKILKARKPEIEIGWDGGINQQNVSELVFGDVDVLNVGGFIQKAEDPAKAFEALKRIADETGTT